MYLYYFAFVFFANNALCADIEITGDLTFDVKIRGYRQRGMDIDIPLRFSIGNNAEKQKVWHNDIRGVGARVRDDERSSSSNSTLHPAKEELHVSAGHRDVSHDTSLDINNNTRGDIDLEYDTGGDEERDFTEDTGEGKQNNKRKGQKKLPKTTTPQLECTYRYPEPWEANAVLSNMMNKLTKLFVMMRRSLYEKTRLRSHADAARLRRFKVVSARNQEAFDRIFANMSIEYKLNYNASRENVLRSNDDSVVKCAEQADVGRAWRQLLEQAQDTYRTAALRCVDLHLGPWLASRDGSMKTHLNSALSSVNKQLLKDLERIRTEQLRALCKLYQLC